MSVSPYLRPDENFVCLVFNNHQGNNMDLLKSLTKKEKRIFVLMITGVSLSKIAVIEGCSVDKVDKDVDPAQFQKVIGLSLKFPHEKVIIGEVSENSAAFSAGIKAPKYASNKANKTNNIA